MLIVKEAAKYLGISASLLYELVARREIAHHKIRSKILFDEADLAAYKHGCRVGVGPERKPAAPRPVLKHLRL